MNIFFFSMAVMSLLIFAIIGGFYMFDFKCKTDTSFMRIVHLSRMSPYLMYASFTLFFLQIFITQFYHSGSIYSLIGIILTPFGNTIWLLLFELPVFLIWYKFKEEEYPYWSFFFVLAEKTKI